jgi:hypothetical protein
VRGEVEIRTPREAADAGLLSPELAEHARVRSDWRLVRNGSRRDRRRAEIDGADDGGITGTMNGVTFRYSAVPSYREWLRSTTSHSSTFTTIPTSARTFFPAGRGEQWECVRDQRVYPLPAFRLQPFAFSLEP